MSGILLPSAARTTSGNAVISGNGFVAAKFMLDVTAAATLVGDTLDVYLQSSLDGTVWDDFAHFTQVLGNGGAKQFIAQFTSLIAPTTALHVPQDKALAAGVSQGPIGGTVRVAWVVVGTGSFTFSLSGRLVRG